MCGGLIDRYSGVDHEYRSYKFLNYIALSYHNIAGNIGRHSIWWFGSKRAFKFDSGPSQGQGANYVLCTCVHGHVLK